jgi:hypothetical protein
MQPTSSKTLRPLTTVDRDRLFGKFKYKPAPLPGNPERIQIIDTWGQENLVKIAVPEPLVKIVGKTASFHRLVAPRFLELVEAWQQAQVLEDIVQWGGSYAPRYIRGSTTNLSAHAWGSAIDVNVPFNPLGKAACAVDQKGSVLRLVPIAEKLGWAWGGRFSRCDGMHFEVCKI